MEHEVTFRILVDDKVVVGEMEIKRDEDITRFLAFLDEQIAIANAKR